MKVTHVRAIARKQFLTLRHDRRSLALMLLAPVMAMLIFGFAFGSSPQHVAVMVVNNDQGTLASKFISEIDHTTLNLKTSTNADTARTDVKNGQAVAAIIFPSTFTKDASPSVAVKEVKGRPVPTVTAPRGAHIEMMLDSTNQQLAAVVPTAMAQAAQKLVASQGAKSPISIDSTYAFPKAKSARYIDYFVPGIMAFAITLFTTLLTLLAFVGERTSGTLSRLKVSPATESEIVLGYELAFGLIAAVQGALILTVAILVYHILVIGPLWVAGLLVVLMAIDAQAIGILASAAAEREGQAVQFLPFIIFPIFLLSGVFVAVQSLPGWLQPFSYILPPTWGISGLRDVLLRGWGIGHVWVNLTVLAGFAVLLTILAILGLRRNR
jgi:ABC-2 type transport system permease protein